MSRPHQRRASRAEGTVGSYARALARIAEQERTIADLRQMLTAYAQHNDGCSARHGAEYRCRCGWREEAARLGIEEGPEK
jgi:uncharacterized protein YjiS (DUF1127 family)